MANCGGNLAETSSATIAPAAPDFATCSRKLCASKFSPRRATNNSPGLMVRESVLTRSIIASADPRLISAPANSAIFDRERRSIKIEWVDLQGHGARPECRQTESCDQRTPDISRALFRQQGRRPAVEPWPRPVQSLRPDR